MNISEIAKLAGVSSAAVSRYFNNGYISEEKKEAIRKVVEQTGYRPSIQAQTLRTKKTKMIGVIVPKIASASIGKIVEGVLSVLNESGYQMLLAVTQNDPKKELEYLSAFNDKQVDGVILAATVVTAEHKKILKNLSVPVILVGQQYSGHCCVYHDDYHATRDLTEAVLDMGRKNPGYIGAIMHNCVFISSSLAFPKRAFSYISRTHALIILIPEISSCMIALISSNFPCSCETKDLPYTDI